MILIPVNAECRVSCSLNLRDLSDPRPTVPDGFVKETISAACDDGVEEIDMTSITRLHTLSTALALALLAWVPLTPAHAATPAELLATYSAQSGTTPNPQKGQQLFVSRHGREWSCASCHGEVPTQGGKHASTGKPIGAMAPAFNAKRFSSIEKSDKSFRRNCNDVMGRECSAAEKADVLSWLMTFKP